MDTALKAALRSVVPPEGGLDAVLAGMKQQTHILQIAPRVEAKWNRRHWIGAAAAAVVLGAGGVWYWGRLRAFDTQNEPTTPEGFLADSVRKAAGSIYLREKSLGWSTLMASQAEIAISVPRGAVARLQSFTPKGCQDYEWRGKKVGLICFRMPDRSLAHLFSVPMDVFPTAPQPGVGALHRVGGRQCCTWAETGVFAVVVAADSLVDISAVHSALS